MKIKNRLDYLLNGNLVINIKDLTSLLTPNLLSLECVFSVSIHYIKYIVTKSSNHVSIDRTDNDEVYLYLFLDNVRGQIEERKRIKYLVFASTGKNKDALKNYTKLWEETKRKFEVLNDDEPIKYRKEFMDIRFKLEDDLTLGKTFSIVGMIIVVTSVLEKKDKYYPKFFFHECEYELQKCCGTKKLMFQKELTLTEQIHQKNVCFVIIGTLKILDLIFNQIYLTNVKMF